MSDERQNGLMCPECGTIGALRVKWTAVKTVFLRRYVFKCLHCGAAVKGYLEIDEIAPAGPGQQCGTAPPHIPPAAHAAPLPPM